MVVKSFPFRCIFCGVCRLHNLVPAPVSLMCLALLVSDQECEITLTVFASYLEKAIRLAEGHAF